jgi:hypothetical protein
LFVECAQRSAFLGLAKKAPAAPRESGDPPSSGGGVVDPEGTSTPPSWPAFARASPGRSWRVPGLGSVFPAAQLRHAATRGARRHASWASVQLCACSARWRDRCIEAHPFGAPPVVAPRPTALRAQRSADGETLLTRGRARVSLRRAEHRRAPLHRARCGRSKTLRKPANLGAVHARLGGSGSSEPRHRCPP